jgi:NADH:ubiquinone oxidoreductase subunit 4 (subunit M)
MIAIVSASIFMPLIASATEPPQITLNKDQLLTLFDNIKTWFAEALFILGILVILYAAFLYMTSGGDDTRIDKAKKAFIYGIVGIIIAMLAYGIWDAIQSFFAG